MKNTFIVLTLAIFSQCVTATPLSAVMTFESMTITSEGVKKQTQFQERFLRDENTVWTERIIPSSVSHKHTEDNHPDHADKEHKHEHNLNFATAGKWLVRDKSNEIKFRFVRTDDKTIIEPRASEYGTLGFDGDWETTYYLVDRNALKKMQVLQKTSTKNTTWYEKKMRTISLESFGMSRKKYRCPSKAETQTAR